MVVKLLFLTTCIITAEIHNTIVRRYLDVPLLFSGIILLGDFPSTSLSILLCNFSYNFLQCNYQMLKALNDIIEFNEDR